VEAVRLLATVQTLYLVVLLPQEEVQAVPMEYKVSLVDRAVVVALMLVEAAVLQDKEMLEGPVLLY
jgi:hypothetical protein